MSEFEQKEKYMIYVKPETIQKADRLYELEGARSRSEFIENAITFYSGFVSANDSLEYYPSVIVTAVQGALESLENRIGRLWFKQTVELAMIMNIIAAMTTVDDDTLAKLRNKCVDEVKRLNGKISFEDILKYQRGED